MDQQWALSIAVWQKVPFGLMAARTRSSRNLCSFMIQERWKWTRETENTDVRNNLVPPLGEAELRGIIFLFLFFFFLPLASIISLYYFNSLSTAKESNSEFCWKFIFFKLSFSCRFCRWWLDRDGHIGSINIKHRKTNRKYQCNHCFWSIIGRAQQQREGKLLWRIKQ